MHSVPLFLLLHLERVAMKSLALTLLLGMSFFMPTASAKAQGQGNNPYGRLDLYQYPDKDFDAFLSFESVPDSISLLPPPPEEGSAEFAADIAAYEAGWRLKDTPRGNLAIDDADISAQAIGRHFAESFGFELAPQTTPVTYSLVSRAAATLGWYGVIKAKQHYQRPRPFMYYNTRSCHPIEEEDDLRASGSYPSGHTAYGWGVALILAEISPERQDALLQRGFEFGQSRIICGAHWQSDVQAGYIMGAATIAKLHTDPAFIRQLAAAKHEVALLRAKAETQ